MIPLKAVEGYDLTLNSLSLAAMAKLKDLLAEIAGMAPDGAKRVLFRAFPELFNPYAAAVSEVSASFYEEVRALSGVGGSFQADSLSTVESDRWNALVGAGTQPQLLSEGPSSRMFDFLAGGLTSVLTTSAADTIYGNAKRERVTVGFQRIPKPGCCGFCGMLASRGAAYESAESASQVVGRGVPVEKTKGKRGGQGGGIKARGSRESGQSFHDHCKCRTVQVYEDNYVEMQADADKYFESYAAARNKVNDGLILESETFKSSDGSLKNTYKWVDSGGMRISSTDKTKLIAKAMRLDLDVK